MSFWIRVSTWQLFTSRQILSRKWQTKSVCYYNSFLETTFLALKWNGWFIIAQEDENWTVQTIGHYSGTLTSVTPKGMLPTYRRRACLVIWLPTTGTCVGATAKPALVDVASRAMLGICPAATLQIKEQFSQICYIWKHWIMKNTKLLHPRPLSNG